MGCNNCKSDIMSKEGEVVNQSEASLEKIHMMPQNQGHPLPLQYKIEEILPFNQNMKELIKKNGIDEPIVKQGSTHMLKRIKLFGKDFDYCGEIEKGTLNGMAFCQDYATKDVYQLNFMGGILYGSGRVYYANGNYYDGEMHAEGMKRGSLFYADGKTYVGQFSNNVPHGKGHLYIKNQNKVISGEFVNGTPTLQAQEEKDTILTPFKPYKEYSSPEKIFISKGLGWAILPIRFNVRPEIAIITLRSAEP